VLTVTERKAMVVRFNTTTTSKHVYIHPVRMRRYNEHPTCGRIFVSLQHVLGDENFRKMTKWDHVGQERRARGT
jgi:hypothetical protein